MCPSADMLQEEQHAIQLSRDTTVYLATAFNGIVSGVAVEADLALAIGKAKSELFERSAISARREPDLFTSYRQLLAEGIPAVELASLPVDFSKSRHSMHEDSELSFVSACNATTSQHAYAPSRFFFPTTSSPKYSSSGAAVAGSVQEASVRGAIELIERDALIRGWLHITQPKEIKCPPLTKTAEAIVAFFSANRWVLSFKLMPSRIPWLYTIVVIGFGPDHLFPSISIGSACSASSSAALEKALLEFLQIHIILDNKGPRIDGHIAEPIDHLIRYHNRALRYRLKETFKAWNEYCEVSKTSGESSTSPPQLKNLAASGLDFWFREIEQTQVDDTSMVLVKTFEPSLFQLQFGEAVIVGPRHYSCEYDRLCRQIDVPPVI